MSTLPVAQLKHVFGLRGGVVGGIAFQDEQTLVYPAGSNIVLYNVEQKVQRFIAGSEKSQMVTAMAITPNRRYIAIAEKGEKSATITIYDVHTLKRKKVLSAADLGISEFVSLAFSPDSKYLASQGGKPEWTLMYWMWEKSKVMASVKTSNPQSNAPVSQVAFNPQDNTVVSVVGQGTLKVFRFTEGNLKLLHNPKNEQHNYLSHAWVSDERLVAGTEQGIWQLFENGELKFEQNASATNATRESIDPGSAIGSDATAAQSSRAITSIAAYSKGFAMALGRGLVNVYDRTEDKSYFRKSREIKIPSDPYSADPSRAEQQLITHMLFSPSEETLSLVTDRSQIYALALSTADLAKGGDTLYFERLAQSFHSASVTGLDVCIRKPLIATCSADRSVRIWNYETCNLELYKEFAEEAYSIALHPSGLYVLVGFSDKLRLMNLLIDDIRSFKEFTVRGCRECSFSNGGHLFAAVHSNVIQVYSTTGFENVANLKGHNGKIRSVVWSADDSKLVSCGMDGAVYEWEPLTGKRVGESVLKTCNYTSVTLLPDAKSVLAVGTDHTLKEISNSTILREVPAGPDVTLASVSMSHSGRMLFAGTATGLLRAVKFPLTVPGEWNEYVAHATAITKMKITYNDELLVSVSEDATIMVWKVSDKEGRGLKRDREVAWAEEILITKSDLEEKNVMMSDLKTRVEELKMENEYQLRLKDMNYNEKIKELTEKFIQEMESLKTKNQVLKTEKDKSEAKHEEELQELLQKHGKEMQDLETSNNAKLMLEYEKYQELQGKSQKMQEDYERQLQEMEEAKERALQELTEFYELRLKERAADLDKAHDQSRTADREHEEGRRQIEEDADREILDLKNTYERRLREEREANMRLKGEAGIMNKKVSSLQREIEEKEELNKKVQTDNQKLQGIIKNLEKDIQGLKKEIQERDEAIQEKEKRIYELKKKNQELEKFKFVLDYKIKELKKQIEPRENEIKQMKEQIQEMESELERFHKQNTTLELTIAESRQRLKATERELAEARQRAHDVESRVRRFQTDLHNCVGYIQDPKMLKDSIVALYRKHAAQDTAAEAGLDADIQREYARQREHLERSVASLRKKLAKDSEIHRLEVVRIMQENVTLIKEINELRRELKQARTRINDLEAALGLHRKGAGAGTSGVPAIAAAGLTGAALEQLELLLGASTQPTSANRPQLERTIDEQERIIEMQRIEIKKLRDQLNSAPPAPGTGGTLLPPLSGSPVHSMQPLDSLV